MQKPILSIVIATKNRVPYCINTIETLLKLTDEDLEIIVQDNTDNLELKDYITAHISDPRFKYNYTAPPFSSIDNFNACVEMATGTYVCMIGDDDGINPEFLKIARYASDKNIDSLGSSQIAEYYWPNAVERYKDGNLSIPKFSGTVDSYNPQKRLIPLLATGIVNYIPFNLPRVYHGLIKKSILDQVKSISGNYFGGLSPDIFSTIATTTLIVRHVLIDYPMTIAGTCGSSTSAASEKGEHTGKLEDAPHFRSREGYKWEERIPKFYSIQTIWAETGIKALKAFDKTNLLKYFNLKFLVAQSILNNKSIKDLIIVETNKVLIEEKKSIFLFQLQVFVLISAIKIRSIIFKVWRYFNKKEDIRTYHNNVKNIAKATELLMSNSAIKNFDVIRLFNEKQV